MTLSVSAAFDSGNIHLVGIEGDRIDLEIRKDHQSDFYQWFHFRLLGAAGRMVTMRILNAGASAYPQGWPDYRACVSEDRENWRRTDTSYADGVLTITHRPQTDSCWFAYFAPYSIERHHDLVARTLQAPGVSCASLGQTLDGQEIDCLSLGDGPKQVWLFARQHPGESMAEYWMEGALAMLTDPDDAVAGELRAKARFHIVPNANPDGSRRGHLRTNAAGINLNREWHAPSLERSPEVFHLRAAMDRTGVAFAIDVHGDESIPYIFLAGFEGIAAPSQGQLDSYAAFSAALAGRTHDFQTKHGYGSVPRGQGNLSMATNQLAARYGAVSMTLEMPFKDNADHPDPVEGWSPARSRQLARDCLAALAAIVDSLGRSV
jgi:murein tripeptide amidase MpaA